MHTLLPNLPGQQVQIFATGGEAVSGIDFFVQIGDGGPTVGGDDTGPTITSLDLVNGTIFAANNSGVFTDPAPLIWGAATTTTSETVPVNGLLATLTIDTTGLSTGQFDLILNPPSTGPTAFADPGVTTNLTNGWLQIGASTTSAGDYNNNGVVDAADYVVWRETFSQMGPGLAADGNGNNQIDPGDYEVWRTNGAVGAASRAAQNQGAGSNEHGVSGSPSLLLPAPSSRLLAHSPPRLGGPAAVPEPTSIALLCLAAWFGTVPRSKASW
jgi:hypothetical protein